MALWIFGDSFSVARENINKGDIDNWPLWHELLANNLGLAGYLNYAQWGVSNEYILEQFLTRQMEYEPGDCIVIQLTSSSRQWFFKDRPEIANFYIANMQDAVTNNEAKAIEMYIKYLHRPEMDELRYFMLVKTLEKISQDLNYCKILILPGFHQAPGVTGTLMDICTGEFESDDSRNKWYDKHNIDPRPNHFGQENHTLLGYRTIEFFQTGKLVDLLNDYRRGFL
jgi:hypothetical protein